MKFSKIHFSSLSGDWETPKELFFSLDSIYRFDLDVCATFENSFIEKFFGKEIDALTQKWKGVCYMNAPYGRGLYFWIRKAYTESLRGALVVCLLPARTDTKWFHKFVVRAESVWFIRGRLKFSDHGNPAPFPSMVVVFGCRRDHNRPGLESSGGQL